MPDMKHILKVLEALKNNKPIPTKEDLDIGLEEYGTLLEWMNEEGIIRNVDVRRAGIGNKVAFILKDGINLTISGMKFLEQNS